MGYPPTQVELPLISAEVSTVTIHACSLSVNYRWNIDQLTIGGISACTGARHHGLLACIIRWSRKSGFRVRYAVSEIKSKETFSENHKHGNLHFAFVNAMIIIIITMMMMMMITITITITIIEKITQTVINIVFQRIFYKKRMLINRHF